MKFLFTDLDGTFLGGTRQDQLRLLEALNTHEIGLVYVSGRSHQRIFPAIDSGELPRPKAVIGDVGTSLWAGDGQALSPDYEALMHSLWGEAAQRLRTELDEFFCKGLREQPLFGPYRYSLYFDDPETARRAAERIQSLGFDSLLSDDQYLDALPPGVHKGFAVNWLLDHWGLDRNNVLVAGDTLNDLAMLQLQMPAVVVANAEPLLKESLSGAHKNSQLLFANQDGAAGIHEALHRMGWIEP